MGNTKIEVNNVLHNIVNAPNTIKNIRGIKKLEALDRC